MKPIHTVMLREVTVVAKSVPGFWGAARIFYRILVLAIVIVMLLCSLIFQDNMFMDLDLRSRIILIVAVLYAFALKKKNQDEITMTQLDFYEDRLVIYRNKRWYLNHFRRVWVTVRYADIRYIKYNAGLRRLTVRGDLHTVWYRYGHEGRLPDKPDYDRFIKDTAEFVCLWYETEIDIVKEIEAHTPITVIINNNQEAK